MDEQSTVKNDLEKIEKICDDFEDKLHLNKIKIIDTDITVRREELLHKSSQELYAIAYEWSQYLLAVQKEINKQTARMNWFDQNLERLLNSNYHTYDGFAWAEKKANCLNNNEVAKKLLENKMKAKMACDRLAYLPSRMEFQINMVKNMAYSKKEQEHVRES